MDTPGKAMTTVIPATSSLSTFDQIERAAYALAKSGLFGVKTTEQALSLMLIAQAEGLHPAIAARDYHVIEGRPALKADAMLARFQAAGGKVEWLELSDVRVAAKFAHPAGGEIEIAWDMEMAARARLSTKVQRDGGPNMWQKFPRQMLRSRVISEGIRTVFPGVCVGVYSVEEVRDMEPAPTGGIKDVTDSERVITGEHIPAGEASAVEKAAREAANKGTAAYAAFWKEISKEARKALAGGHADLKAAAARADAINQAEYNKAIRQEAGE